MAQSANRQTHRTYTVILTLIVVVAGLAFLVLSNAAYGKFVEEKVLTEARTLSVEAASAWDYVNEAQDAINYNSDGTYDFKGVYCTIAGKSIARKFTMRSEGYEMRYVRDNPRSAHDVPDDFEAEALANFVSEGSDEYYGIVDTPEGGTAFRYLVPLKAEYNCLQCHGDPAGEPDVTGHAKEGMQLGDLAGAVSISIPMAAYEDESRFRVLQAVVFVLVLLIAAVIVVRLALRRLVVEPLEKENETLHDESQMKTDFLDSVSHDMRTPLASIIAFTDLWEEKLKDKRGAEAGGALDTDEEMMLAEIRANSQILLNMVGNTLDASRLDAGRLALSCQELDVADVLQSVIVALGPVAKKRGIKLYRQFDMDAPLVVSDELALQKIVMNLVGNAVKFSPDNAEVAAVVRSEGDSVVVEVLDRGPGIAEEELAHIFERFAQAGDKASSSQGCGLGLYVSASLAQALGAQLSAENREGGGAVFTLRIPPIAPGAEAVAEALDDFEDDDERAVNEEH